MARAPPVGLEPWLTAVNRALHYFNFTFSQKIYVQITCYKGRILFSLNVLDDEIDELSLVIFQYTCEIKIDEISIFNIFLHNALLSLIYKR